MRAELINPFIQALANTFRTMLDCEVTPVCIPFSCDWGPLKLEVGLAPVPAAVTV